MAAAGTARSARFWVSLGFALITPLGALLFYLGAGPWAQAHPAWLGAALAFCAGTFLCIACADLLPELQFHTHDRLALTLALVFGVLTALGIVRFAHAGPGHDHAAAPTETAAPHARGHLPGLCDRRHSADSRVTFRGLAAQ